MVISQCMMVCRITSLFHFRIFILLIFFFYTAAFKCMLHCSTIYIFVPRFIFHYLLTNWLIQFSRIFSFTLFLNCKITFTLQSFCSCRISIYLFCFMKQVKMKYQYHFQYTFLHFHNSHP